MALLFISDLWTTCHTEKQNLAWLFGCFVSSLKRKTSQGIQIFKEILPPALPEAVFLDVPCPSSLTWNVFQSSLSGL